VYEAVGVAVDRARSGNGPSLVESKFYRLSAHGNSITVPPMTTQFGEHEAIEVYGNGDEYSAAKARDPIPKFRTSLIAQGILTGADAQKIETAARAEMDAAVNYALASPLPAPEEATNHIFA
jgi:pyruvate dehydrogenase E1 component alpha subunit